MIRFLMPLASLSLEERVKDLNLQFDRFLNSDCLREYLSFFKIESTNPEVISKALGRYDPRDTGDLKKESQEVKASDYLLSLKSELFPFYREMGLVDINRPNRDYYDRIVLLGGSANSNFDKTKAAKRLLNNNVREVSALSCFRPIPYSDIDNVLNREDNIKTTPFETEFGSFLSAYTNYLDADEICIEHVINSPRNINKSSAIKTFRDKEMKDRIYKVYACPSLTDTERAGTYDTCVHYLDSINVDEKAAILFVTNNQYVNYQFLGAAISVLECKRHCIDFDIVGCSPDNNLTSEDEYNVVQYFGDIRYSIQWIDRFRKKFIPLTTDTFV